MQFQIWLIISISRDAFFNCSFQVTLSVILIECVCVYIYIYIYMHIEIYTEIPGTGDLHIRNSGPLRVFSMPDITLSICSLNVEFHESKVISSHSRVRNTNITRTMHACSVVSKSLWSHGRYPARLLYPWGFPSNNTGMGCHFLLQRIFSTQGWNPHLLCLLHWQADSSYPWVTREAQPEKETLMNITHDDDWQ